MDNTFDYDLAFSRNIGWFTPEEQQILRSKKVAIAGMGGVGGGHLLALTRLGIGRFVLADFDRFGCENTNRQVGATVDSYGKNKLDVMVDMAKAINPELEITLFREGVNDDNAQTFMTDVDCYVDSLDFFVIDIRRRIFDICARQGIPATTAAPLGMGTAYLNFMPGKMTFEQYFGMAGCNQTEQYLRFLLGLAPAALHRRYLVMPEKIDLANKKGPSTVVGCQLAAGVTAAQVAKIFLNRGDIVCVPKVLQFDAYSNRYQTSWRPWGYRNPIQQLAFHLGKKQIAERLNQPNDQQPEPQSIAMQVLDLARWSPSGDNSQCWRFEVLDETSFIVKTFDTSESVVYDLDGHSSHLAHGALLETIVIAAGEFGMRADVEEIYLNNRPQFKVNLVNDKQIIPSPLAKFIKTRTVQRRAMGSRPLTDNEKSRLQNGLLPGFSVRWFDSPSEKRAFALMNFANGKTRLTMKEAYATHKEIIDWHQQFSHDKVPEKALGLDWFTSRLTQWLFKSWSRVNFCNRFLAGSFIPRLQLDLLPGLRCSAHFAIIADEAVTTTAQYVEAGRAVQRFWLTASELNLGLQPGQTPLIFARYLNNQISFCTDKSVLANAEKCANRLTEILPDSDKAVFLGRLGRGETANARSLRLPLEALMEQ